MDLDLDHPRTVASGGRDPDRPRAPRGTLKRRRPRRWIALVATLALLVPTLISYGQALTAPGTDSLAIRSTEWLRSHHFRWLVNDVENFYYTHHQPKKGGAPRGAVAQQISAAGQPLAAGPVAPAPGPVTPPAARSVGLPAPQALAPIAPDPLAGEGQWRPLGEPVAGQPAMYATYMRPDAVHTSLVTALAWIDARMVRAVGYAGVQEPGGGPWANHVPIPDSVRPGLLAAFNSGFKMQDAQGGYYADGKYARPLRNGAATAWIDTNGVLNIGAWGRDVTMTPAVVFARQNLALIVDKGQPVPDVLSGNSSKWGATVGAKVLVWRSGLGVTADGAVVYVGGPGLSALTLAQVMARAGVVRGMELDINSAWVDFFTYSPAAAGKPPGALTVTKLLANMAPSTSNYLDASSRDCFALFARS